MASKENNNEKVTSLRQEERRNHFVRKIEKYEAKIRQEQKERAMLRQLREQRATLTQQNAVMLEKRLEERLSLSEKIDSHKQNGGFPVQKSCGEEEREDSPEQKTISEQRNSTAEHRSFQPLLQRAVSWGQKTVLRDDRAAAEIPFFVPARKSDAGDTKSLAFTVKDVHLPSKVEVNAAVTAAALKIRIKAADMAALMQEHAFRCAREVLDGSEKINCKRVAYVLKKEFDKSYGPAWHCIVGTSFGSYVTHSLGGFLYFSIDKASVLLFKTSIEPLER